MYVSLTFSQPFKFVCAYLHLISSLPPLLVTPLKTFRLIKLHASSSFWSQTGFQTKI